MIFEPRYFVYSASVMAALVLLAAGLFAALYLGTHGSSLRWRRKLETPRRRASAVLGKVIEITPISLENAREERPPAKTTAASPSSARVLAKLVPIGGGHPVEIFQRPPNSVSVGREPDCSIVLDDSTISRRHCRFDLDAAGTLRIQDLNSGNGTRINGKQISSGTVKAGDRIGLGSLEFRLEFYAGTNGAAEPLKDLPTWQLAAIDEQGNMTSFRIDGGANRTWTIGRINKHADFVIASPSISARHAMLRSSADGSLEIRDLGSSNGTSVSGRKIGPEWTIIKAPSHLTLGECEIKLT